MHAFVAAALRGLDDATQGYCVLRNYESLPDLAGSHDVDLLIDRESLEQATSAVIGVARKCGGALLVRRRLSYLTVLRFGVPDGSGQGVKFDLFTSVEWRGIPLIDPVTVLCSRRQHRDIWVPSRQNEMVITWLKCLANGGGFKAQYAGRVRQWVLEDPARAHEALQSAVGPALAAALVEAMASEEGTPPHQWMALVRRGLVTHGVRSAPVAAVANAGRLLWREVLARATATLTRVVVRGGDQGGREQFAARVLEALDKTPLQNGSNRIRRAKVAWEERVAEINAAAHDGIVIDTGARAKAKSARLVVDIERKCVVMQDCDVGSPPTAGCLDEAALAGAAAAALVQSFALRPRLA